MKESFILTKIANVLMFLFFISVLIFFIFNNKSISESILYSFGSIYGNIFSILIYLCFSIAFYITGKEIFESKIKFKEKYVENLKNQINFKKEEINKLEKKLNSFS